MRAAFRFFKNNNVSYKVLIDNAEVIIQYYDKFQKKSPGFRPLFRRA